MRFVENFLHRQQLDDPPRSLVERGAFLLGVFGITEGDEKAAVAALDLLARAACAGGELLHDDIEIHAPASLARRIFLE